MRRVKPVGLLGHFKRQMPHVGVVSDRHGYRRAAATRTAQPGFVHEGFGVAAADLSGTPLPYNARHAASPR